MNNKEIENVDIFIEYINGQKEQDLCEKYKLNLSVIKAKISYGRQEYYNTTYWKDYLKPIIKTS
jgi:hypothetical protein